MFPLIQKIGTLLLGAILGAYIQGKREQMNRLRERIAYKIGDEIASAKINGNVSHEEALSEWSEISEAIKKELPDPIRTQFGIYYSNLTRLDNVKGSLENFRENTFPQIENKSSLFCQRDSELFVASGCITIDQQKLEIPCIKSDLILG